jgi:hypothetical protein
MSTCVLGSVQIKNVCVLPLTQINPPSSENVLVKVDPYLFKYKDEIDLINNVDEFRDFILTRLIDPKSRQVIRDYPLLRYLFDKYLNLCGLNDCENLSNQYNYNSLQNFIDLVGDYWIELVEQLVPSTSIWKGATRYYRNTVFDQPKFKYKNYSLLTCDSDCDELLECNNCVGLENENIEVIIENIQITTGSTTVNCIENKNKIKCSEIFIKSINDDVIFSGKIGKQYNITPIFE